jgi:excisionase family DNA binding protein
MTKATDAQLSTAEAARALGVSVDAVYKLIYAAKLAARKVNGVWVISATAVEARAERRGKHK